MEFEREEALQPHENEFFELYYLQSRPAHITHAFPNNFLIRHSGIALRSSTTEQIIALEYRPANESICFLPQLTKNDGEQTIIWDQTATISMTKSIDSAYWDRTVYLTRINNVVYRQYLDWVDDYIFSHPLFQPFSVCLSSMECPYRKQTWDTFVSDSFEKLSEFAVTINPITPLFELDWIFHSQRPPERLLLHSDPSVIPYFAQLLSCLRGTALSLSLSLTPCVPHRSQIKQRTFLLILFPRQIFVRVSLTLQPSPGTSICSIWRMTSICCSPLLPARHLHHLSAPAEVRDMCPLHMFQCPFRLLPCFTSRRAASRTMSFSEPSLRSSLWELSWPCGRWGVFSIPHVSSATAPPRGGENKITIMRLSV
jgi:hypothetical protein